MSQTKEVKYTSRSVTPPRNRHSKSISPSRSRSRSRSRSQDSAGVGNPGNNLYVTGLSTRVNNSDLEKYFNKEGKVLECNVIVDPRTRESRGFAFVTMETLEDANRCVKYLHHSVLEGRLITVEKAKRKRGRTPTPGKYRGARDRRGDLGRRIKAAFEEKYQGNTIGVHPRVLFAYKYLEEECKKAAFNMSLKDLSFCNQIPILGYYQKKEKFGARRSTTYKGKPHNSHARIEKKKHLLRNKKCKCFLCGEEGHFARDCPKEYRNTKRVAMFEGLEYLSKKEMNLLTQSIAYLKEKITRYL